MRVTCLFLFFVRPHDILRADFFAHFLASLRLPGVVQSHILWLPHGSGCFLLVLPLSMMDHGLTEQYLSDTTIKIFHFQPNVYHGGGAQLFAGHHPGKYGGGGDTPDPVMAESRSIASLDNNIN
ncbi:hypothetical protein SCLCIDRAFT_823160 [Scleroderma citrinum Foug A]|uniref:Uncharacterized protein n=1 Tax=Scleroderma citrinum Foug A TaxID=1036808 RepID=A0A0C3ELW9_9AGAM|nr:hypothetical protein SCLCIDRAFT_823160 [Scleroderma citrinum Foug A]